MELSKENDSNNVAHQVELKLIQRNDSTVLQADIVQLLRDNLANHAKILRYPFEPSSVSNANFFSTTASFSIKTMEDRALVIYLLYDYKVHIAGDISQIIDQLRRLTLPPSTQHFQALWNNFRKKRLPAILEDDPVADVKKLYTSLK